MSQPDLEALTAEVIDFWRLYCARNRVSIETQSRGESLIEDDPEHWYESSMSNLWSYIER